MPRLRHYDSTGAARFITFTCYKRHRYLTDLNARRFLIEGLQRMRIVNNVRILGWVFMPEHIHLVLDPPENSQLGSVIGRFKEWSAAKIIAELESNNRLVLSRADGNLALWQRRCYDHNCRTFESVREKILYCHRNPVNRGLVAHPSKWPWSSHNWYTKEGEVLLEIDGLEL